MAPCFFSAVATFSTSISPPSDQCTEEIEASAIGSPCGRSIASSTAEVQSPSAGCATVSTMKSCARARDIHSSTGEV